MPSSLSVDFRPDSSTPTMLSSRYNFDSDYSRSYSSYGTWRNTDTISKHSRSGSTTRSSSLTDDSRDKSDSRDSLSRRGGDISSRTRTSLTRTELPKYSSATHQRKSYCSFDMSEFRKTYSTSSYSSKYVPIKTSDTFSSRYSVSPLKKDRPLESSIFTEDKKKEKTDTTGLCGLRNIGNTCFLNSVVQCLAHTRLLKEYLLGKDLSRELRNSDTKGSLIKAFAEVISELWGEEGKVVNPTNFKAQIQRYAPRFMGYNQQDAQEFLRYLLEGIHNDINRVTSKPKNLPEIDDDLSDSQKAIASWDQYLRIDNSEIVDLFVGQLKSTLQCTSCGHRSTTFEPFWDLSLPLLSRSSSSLRLSQCLEHFTKEEVLDGDEMPTCSKCKTRRKCTKRFSIQKFPKILVLHLKRFSGEKYRKLSAQVDFPLTNLDMSAYSSNSQSLTYNLYAVSNHSGTASSGHYTAYCLHCKNQQWYEFNDSRVSPISPKSVVSNEAYLLFYELSTARSSI